MSKTFDIHISRYEQNKYCIFGDLTLLVDGEVKFKCKTLENPVIGVEKEKDLAIPSGVYNVHFRHSPQFSEKLQGDVLCIYNDVVPKERYILIHNGNYEKHTKGCILLGKDAIDDPNGANGKMVTASITTCSEFYKLVRELDVEGSKVVIENNF